MTAAQLADHRADVNASSRLQAIRPLCYMTLCITEHRSAREHLMISNDKFWLAKPVVTDLLLQG